MGNSIPSWIWPVAISGVPWVMSILHQRQTDKELDRNDFWAPPSDRQVRWHIRHTRQDVMLIAYLLMGITNVLIYIAWRLTP